MNYNITKLNSLLSSSIKDLDKNTLIYETTYEFYKNKNLLTNEIDLLIIDIENKLTNKKTYIKSSTTFFISIALSFITTTITNAINKNHDSILGTIFGISLSFLIFGPIFYRTFFKNYKIDNQEKLIYIVILKVLNDLKAKA